MRSPKNGDYFYKNLTASDYRTIANSAQSENITRIANWLPERINKIYELYAHEKKVGVPLINISNDTWKELAKGHERLPRSNSFLAHITNDQGIDEYYHMCCNQIAKTVTLLETILENAINKPEKFLLRRKPQECLIKKINNEADYLQLIALTLKEIYEQYPDKEGILFPHKNNLSSFIDKINPEQTAPRYVRGQ